MEFAEHFDCDPRLNKVCIYQTNQLTIHLNTDMHAYSHTNVGISHIQLKKRVEKYFEKEEKKKNLKKINTKY